jgi:ubiquinone/menaquinone biosynthesis C-methylase UbiE
MARIFERVDGIDISKYNLNYALQYCIGLDNQPKLYESDGITFNKVTGDSYNFVYSTITMQHIALHVTRIMILKEIYGVLKKGGRFAIQMTFIEDIKLTINSTRSRMRKRIGLELLDGAIIPIGQQRRTADMMS